MPNLRREDTSAGFISGNPVLAAGEHGYETDTEASKIGDGVTPWANLPYSGANPTNAALNATYDPLGAATAAAAPKLDSATAALTYGRPHVGTVALLGDSILKQGSLSQGSGATLQNMTVAMGIWPRANALMGQRLTLIPGPSWDSFGDSGLTIRQIIDNGHVAALIAANPEWAICHFGTNSIVAGNQSAASTFADYREAVTDLTNAGIKVVATTILPRMVGGNVESTVAQRAALAAANKLIVDWARSAKGVYLCNWSGSMIDPTDGNGLQTYSRDLTHPNSIGASRLAKVLADTMSTFIPVSDCLPSAMATGVMSIGRVLQAGTTGSFSGSNPGGGSGQGAANSVTYVDTGTTVVLSKVARTDLWPGEWQQFAVSAATATAGFKYSIQNANVGTDWNIGDNVYAVVEFQTDAASWQGRQLSVQCTCNGTSAFGGDGIISSADLAALTAALHQPGVAGGTFRTKPIVIPTGTTRLQIDVFFAGGTGTIRVGRAQIYKV
ncbi:hypothetical protein SAMN04487914_13251 [Arthrobacter sp. ok909]|uniref:GDSL-type esterase/lipase family protein n=1 Tax=Arthrobacter sp. ok909 TaxID=1761746 RepID=UPI000890F9D6|nr:GDSL-type esterase/lipase family protein [Arthrobacter sp. ok909]SDP74206.1 hypothetical protein SAMN04487914_13251 [Arthrobacter sp. ok909]